MKARDNPFGSSRVLTAIRYATPEGGAAAASLLPRLAVLGYRAAIVGPHGSGKTTLLEDIEVGWPCAGSGSGTSASTGSDTGCRLTGRGSPAVSGPTTLSAWTGGAARRHGLGRPPLASARGRRPGDQCAS